MPTTYSARSTPLSKNAAKPAFSDAIVLGYDFTGHDAAHENGVPWIYAGATSPNLSVTGTQSLVTAAGEPGRVAGASSLYDYTNAANFGQQFGTGDFTIAIRASTPSTLPTTSNSRSLLRLNTAGSTSLNLQLWESANNGWYVQAAGSSAAPLGSVQAATIFNVDTVLMVFVTRVAGVVSVYTQNVTTQADVAVRNQPGAAATAPLNPDRVSVNFATTGANLLAALQAITFWNVGKTAAELSAIGKDFYSTQSNATAADSIALTSVGNGATLGTPATLSGTYFGAAPTGIEAQFNGGAWVAGASASIGGGAWSASFNLATGGPGVLRVREANATGVVSPDVTAITVAADGIAFTTPATPANGAVAYRLFQRDASDQAQVRIAGTYTGTPTNIEYSWGGAWLTLDAAPSGGAFDKTITLAGPGQNDLRVRFGNSPGVSATLPAVSVGDLFFVMGQSNHVGGGNGEYVAPIAPAAHPGWVAPILDKTGRWRPNVETATDPFSKTTNASNYPAASATYPVQASSSTAQNSYFGRLATLCMAVGVPVAFVPSAIGSTNIAAWAAGSATNTLYGAAAARAAQLGAHKAVLWWQGEADCTAGTTNASYQASLNAIINDWCGTRFPAADWVLMNLNQAGNAAGSGGTGTADTGFNAIHAAISSVAASNPHVVSIGDMNGAFAALHYASGAEITNVSNRAYSAINAAYEYESVEEPADTTGPVLTGAISVASITSTSAVVSWPAATDAVGVAGYEYSTDGGASYIGAGTGRTAALVGLAASTVYALRVRAYDLAGNRSAPLAESFTTLADQAPEPGDVDGSKIAASRKVVFPGGVRVVPFGTRPSSIIPGAPSYQGGKWLSDKHPLDERYWVADISIDLAEADSTAVSVVPIVAGVTVLEQPVIQGMLIPIKLGGLDLTAGAANYCTFRVTLANGEQLDRTIWFRPQEGKWELLKDPEDKRYYVADVENDLADSNTTATDATAIPVGVAELVAAQVQDGLIVVKLGGMDTSPDPTNYCTLRIDCANSERFYRTIHFTRVDN